MSRVRNDMSVMNWSRHAPFGQVPHEITGGFLRWYFEPAPRMVIAGSPYFYRTKRGVGLLCQDFAAEGVTQMAGQARRAGTRLKGDF